MKTYTHITLDISHASFPPLIDAKQYDSGTRYVVLTITDKGAAWIIPEGVHGIVNITKPDNTVCWYDTDPVGNPVVEISGNKVTFLLAPQALTVSGEAVGDLSLYDAEGHKLTTFTFTLQIQKAAVADSRITSTDYFNALSQTAAQILSTQSMVKPLGFYSTVEELETDISSPDIGDMYGVGLSAPYEYYVWDGAVWVNNGEIGSSGIPYIGVAEGTPNALAVNYSGVIGNGEPFVFSPKINGASGATLKIGASDAFPILNHDGTPIDDNMLYANVPIVAIYRAASDDAEPAYIVTLDGSTGEPGATFTPSISSDGVISWSNDRGLNNPEPVNIIGPVGPVGPSGKDGATGPKGDPGKGFSILGYFPDIESLENSITSPDAGDSYGVGTSEPYDIYTWDGENNDWVNNGPIQGAEGKPGVTYTPSVSTDGVISWTNDGGLQNPNPVTITGPAGERGPNSVTGETATTIDGLLMGDGEFVSAAMPGTDYSIPDKVSTITLSSAWEGSGPYTQTVSSLTVDSKSKVDLQPDSSVIAQLVSDKVVGLYIANDGGNLTAYAVGSAPTVELTVQVTISEVIL